MPTAPRTWLGVCLLVLASSPAHAFTHTACLLMGKVRQVEVQPLDETLVQLHIQGVRNDNIHANEVECPKVYKTGALLRVSLNPQSGKPLPRPQTGDGLWLSLRTSTASNGALMRKVEVITREAYMERKNGIQ